ncbi:hypothetical protein Pmani_011799 [Petrolisthes manimaculis]|uniref:Uncharacterized protein n=1 Tax=Petrolisthes manimaculis TaxID=1843537 RepID=A0AAE1UE28_9EUCA|nr:hypothetical protein Pmani_011799 [Petrolisthes manimaculis]
MDRRGTDANALTIMAKRDKSGVMWCDGRGRHPSPTTTTTTTTIPCEEVAATGSEINPKKAGVYCTTFTANVSMLNSYPFTR